MNEKSSDSNLHFSMIADNQKINNNMIEELNQNLSDTSENSDNISEVYSDNNLDNNLDNGLNNSLDNFQNVKPTVSNYPSNNILPKIYTS